jgi:hypothetical protein
VKIKRIVFIVIIVPYYTFVDGLMILHWNYPWREKEKQMEKSMSKQWNIRQTDGSERNGGIKNTTNIPPRPQVTPPPQKPPKK